MKKISFKKLLAFFTMLAMVLSVVAVPNVSAKADEATSGTYDCANTWWNGATNIVCYVADDSTIGALETEKGNHPGDIGFAWWTSIVLELQDNGTYVVKEILIPDGVNTKLDVAVTTGKLVISYYSDATKQDSVAFYNSLKVGDALFADCTYEEIKAVTKVATFTKATTKGALNVVNGIGRLSEDLASAYDIVAVSTTDAKSVAELTGATNLFGWWNSLLLEKDTTKDVWVVKGVDAVLDGVCDFDNEKLGENKLLIAIHGGVEDTASAAFFLGTAAVGREYYLVGEIPANAAYSDAGTALTGVYLTTEKPVAENPGNDNDGDEAGKEDGGEKIDTTGDFSSMGTITVLMVAVALVSVGLVLKKRNTLA